MLLNFNRIFKNFFFEKMHFNYCKTIFIHSYCVSQFFYKLVHGKWYLWSIQDRFPFNKYVRHSRTGSRQEMYAKMRFLLTFKITFSCLQIKVGFTASVSWWTRFLFSALCHRQLWQCHPFVSPETVHDNQ
jgi:hypothetical protein